MSIALDHDTKRAGRQAVQPEKTDGTNKVQVVVVGLLIVAAVGLLIYQMFGCPTCYAL